MKKKKKILIAACICFLLALGITLYPLISMLYNEKHHAEIHTEYLEIVSEAADTTLDEARNRARMYNEALLDGVYRLDIFSGEGLEYASMDYAEQLNVAGNGIMGFVSIPQLSISLPIYHGTDATTLERGVGHLLGSSLPIGGENTHTILTAHSGMASQKMFSDLDVMKKGDLFYLEVLGETLAYEVSEVHTVLPHDTTHLGIDEGMDQCTLVTCTPFGINTHRLLVTGSRVELEDLDEQIENNLPAGDIESTWEQKYLYGIAGGFGLVLILLLGYLVVRQVRRRGCAKD